MKPTNNWQTFDYQQILAERIEDDIRRGVDILGRRDLLDAYEHLGSADLYDIPDVHTEKPFLTNEGLICLYFVSVR